MSRPRRQNYVRQLRCLSELVTYLHDVQEVAN